jgi:excisionase family DNA binding protein
MADERWFTVQQIADLLQVHPETVREWLRDGRLQGRKLGNRGGWRVRESVLNAFLTEDDEGKAARLISAGALPGGALTGAR